MKPISHVRLFRAGRLPDLDEPIVIVTFEQTREEAFFAEFFILYQKTQRVFSCRYLCREHAKEFLEARPPEEVIEDTAEYARAEIEGQLVEKLPEEQQFKWVLGPPYTLTPIKLEQLRTFWFRGQLDEPIRQMYNTSRSVELKHELEKIFSLPRLKLQRENPAYPNR